MNDSVVERARAGVDALVCAFRAHHDFPSLLEAMDGIADVLGMISSAAEHLHEHDPQTETMSRAYAAGLRRLSEETRRIESLLLGERERLMRERDAVTRAQEWATATRRLQ